MLRSVGLSSAALLLTGCAVRRKPYVLVTATKSGPRRFAPVEVDKSRIIRRVVGLRPFRPSGFVVRAESLGDKLLVHNYGHGGGGVTLSWGTAELAAEHLIGRTGPVAVIGCGAVGLATARILQRRGFEVTIYARDMPPDTTSNVAGASWFPSSVIEGARRTPAFDAQFERAARLAFRHFQLMTGSEYGVTWREQYSLRDQPNEERWTYSMLRDLFPAPRELKSSQHPFPLPYAYVDNMMFIEPSIYLNSVLRDFFIAGGRFRRAVYSELTQIANLTEPVIINCTGLGSRELFNDPELTPLKGQLTVLLPQPEVDYAVISSDLYMFPRRDGILLGGTSERGVETLTPNLEAEERIILGHQKIFSGMH